jgi:predicted cupin superfamily sugar epimerase
MQRREDSGMQPTAEEIVAQLGLVGPTTCGFVSETYRSQLRLPSAVLQAGFDGSRSLGDVYYFLVTPTARVRLHRIRSDQMYHHYLGGPLEVLLLYENGSSEIRVVGSNLAAGERPQLFLPANTFHAARVVQGAEYSLLGTSVWLRAEPADVEVGDVDALASEFPAAAKELASFFE